MDKRKKHFARLKAEEQRRKPPTKAQKRNQMCTYLKNMAGFTYSQLKNKSFDEVQKAFDKTMSWIDSFKPIDSEVVKGSETRAEGSSKRAGEELQQESTKKQKMDDDKEKEEFKQFFEIVPNDGDDRIVKDRFKKTKPVDYMDTFLLLTLKTMFEHHAEDTVWKKQHSFAKVLNWKLFDSYGVHSITIQSITFYQLVEKMYLLANHTLSQMFNDVKLQVDYECEMTFDLFRLVKKQLKEGYKMNIKFRGGLLGLKDFLVLLKLLLLVMVSTAVKDGRKYSKIMAIRMNIRSLGANNNDNPNNNATGLAYILSQIPVNLNARPASNEEGSFNARRRCSYKTFVLVIPKSFTGLRVLLA
ncbi:hypothetical protein Tco_0739364 [Tanacetum coccineum]